MPVSVLKVTVTSDNKAFEAFNAFTVIVEVVEPSDFTVGGEAERLRESAVVVVVGVPGVVGVSAPPPVPQPDTINGIKKHRNNHDKSAFR